MILFLHGCHNLYFRRNHVTDVYYFAEIMSPMYIFWWRSWTLKSFRRTFIIRRLHRRLICFPSNLHVTGFSSWRITSMIHSFLVCVCVCKFCVSKLCVSKLCCVWASCMWASCVCVQVLCEQVVVPRLPLCVSKLCVCASSVWASCVWASCVCKLCVSKYVSKLCVWKFCVSKFCVSKLCVSKLCWRRDDGRTGGRTGCRIKNKNPTQRCGEKHATRRV